MIIEFNSGAKLHLTIEEFLALKEGPGGPMTTEAVKVGDVWSVWDNEPPINVKALKDESALWPYLIRSASGGWVWESSPDRPEGQGARWAVAVRAASGRLTIARLS